MEYVTLNNGVKMPKLGFGVYQTPADETERCVSECMDVKYPFSFIAAKSPGAVNVNISTV